MWKFNKAFKECKLFTEESSTVLGMYSIGGNSVFAKSMDGELHKYKVQNETACFDSIALTLCKRSQETTFIKLKR